VVVLLVAIGYGVRLWGPMNPAIRMSVSWDGTSPEVVSNDAPQLVPATVWLHNASHSPVTLLRARVERRPSAVPQLSGTRPTVVSAVVNPEGRAGNAALPYVLGAGRQTDVQVVVRVTDCSSDVPGDQTYRLVVDVRTTSGRVKTVAPAGESYSGFVQSEGSTSCQVPLALPSPGVQPADVPVAQQDVRHAYAVVYDVAGQPAARRAAIDDPAGLDEPSRSAESGPYGAQVRSVVARVDRIVFTSPTTAAVAYELMVDGSPYAARAGDARLVDGRWKVTRATVCGDLALAQVTCPRP
jgi:hypothetical protein